MLMLAVSLTATTGCTAVFGDGDSLTVVDTDSSADWDTVRSDFTDQTGIRVTKDEGAAPAEDTDALHLDLLAAFRAHDEGLLASFTGDGISSVPTELRSADDTWFTVHTTAVAIIVNTAALDDIAPPTGWADLTEKRYTDMIAFPDPVTDSIGYTMLHAVDQAINAGSGRFEDATEWAVELIEGGATMADGDMTSRLVSGDTPIVIGSDADGHRLAAANDDIRVILPEEGTLAIPYAMAKSAAAPHPNNADAFLTYALSPTAQSALARSYVRPVTDVPIPDATSAVLGETALVKLPNVADLEATYGEVVAAWNIHVFG